MFANNVDLGRQRYRDAHEAIPNLSKFKFLRFQKNVTYILTPILTTVIMTTELASNFEDYHEQKYRLSSPTDSSTWPPHSRGPDARITIKNRRKRYLDTHPEYFSSPSLELAGLPIHQCDGYCH